MKLRIGLVLLVLVIAGVTAYGIAVSRTGGPQPRPATEAATASPKPVSVEGSIVPIAHGKLAFQTGGRVRAVHVQAGHEVRAGEALAQLDTGELELALQAALDDLALARAQEAQAREGALPEQIAAAAAGVRAGRTRLEELMAGPREAERRAAQAAVEQAAARRQDALAHREQLLAQPRPVDVESARSALEKAQRDAEAAQARLEQLERGATAEDLAMARAGVDRAAADLAAARASLAQLLAGPTPADVAAVQAQLDQARTKLAQLQDAPRATPQDLANARLAVEQARVALDKARADAADANLVGPGKVLSRQAADAVVRQGQLQLETAQNSYDKLRAAGPSDWDLRLAQEAMAQAQAAHERVVRPPTAQEVARPEAQVAAAAAALESAQAKLTQVARGATDADLIAARGTLAAVEAGVAAAQARLEQVVAGPTDEERRAAAAAVAAAVADLRSAEARRDQLLAGATDADQEHARSGLASAVATDAQTRRGATEAALQVTAARTRRAETGVEQARLTLDRTMLRAPFTGIVTSVAVREGEHVSAGTVAATIADLSRLQVETRDLDETATARVHEGQDVAVIVTALDRKALPGQVLAIARQPTTNQSGDVFYTATIALSQLDSALRWGMTVRVEFK